MDDGSEASTNNVRFLKTDPKARFQGYKFYFREGFCWNNVLNPEARLLKVKLKGSSVNDVGSMSLFPLSNLCSSKYIIALLNSNLLFDFYREFINCSVNIQINDIRQVPIIIPSALQLNNVESAVIKAIAYRIALNGNDKSELNSDYLVNIENEIDGFVNSIYMI